MLRSASQLRNRLEFLNAKSMAHPFHNLHTLLPSRPLVYLFAFSSRSALIFFPQRPSMSASRTGSIISRLSTSQSLAHRAIPLWSLWLRSSVRIKARCRGVDSEPLAPVAIGSSTSSIPPVHDCPISDPQTLSSTAFTRPSNVCLTVGLGNRGPNMMEERRLGRKARSSV